MMQDFKTEYINRVTGMNILCDAFGRRINYLRMAVTDRCNLRCYYCMPDENVSFSSRKEILSIEEMLLLIDILAESGIGKLRLTGGEPLLRKGLFYFIKEVKAKSNIGQLTLTTNGVLLEELIDELRDAGVDGINVSLDTLNDFKYKIITGKPYFKQVIRGIEKALSEGFNPIKINVVVVKGLNDDEILDFVNLTRDKPLIVRFIEYMPFNGKNWESRLSISTENVKGYIEGFFRLKRDAADLSHNNYIPYESKSRNINTRNQFKGCSTSENFIIRGHAGKIGFIPSFSRRFCKNCNRIRITTRGFLRLCLYSGEIFNLRDLMRSGSGRDEIRDYICAAVRHKPYNGLIAEESGKSDKFLSMYQIGG